MQLTKLRIRNTPTYDPNPFLDEQKRRPNPAFAPKGVMRRDEDFNQVKNAQQRNRNARGDSFANAKR